MLWRLVTRNLLVSIGIALPVALLSGIAVTAVLPPAWVGAGGRVWQSVSDAAGGFVFWYVLLVLPTLAAALLHQVVLAALPHHWSRRTTRLAIIGTTLAGGAGLGWWTTVGKTEVHVAGLVGALLPALLAYAALVRPLRPDAA